MRPDPASRRLGYLHYVIGLCALLLACFSALCIYFYTSPVHASSGNTLTNGKTSNARVVFDDTETETPSRTPTPSPSATVTSTATPVPSPSATGATTPTATSTRLATATARPSSTATNGQTPALVNVATGGQQTPAASPVSTTRQRNQASQGAGARSSSFPVVPLIICLGSLVLLVPLLKGLWGAFHPASPKAKVRATTSPRRVFAPLSHAYGNNQQDAFFAQRTFDLAAPPAEVLPKDQFVQAVQPGRDVAVPATGQPTSQAQTPSEPSTDELEVSNPALRAWVRTYIY
jgi:hypothetical protein